MRKWLPLITVCLGTFMLLVDVTIVNVALPNMAKDLHTSFSSLQWVVDAYALTLAALVLGTGSIADILGHRQAYIAGLALFAVASFMCGIAPNAGVLVAVASSAGRRRRGDVRDDLRAAQQQLQRTRPRHRLRHVGRGGRRVGGRRPDPRRAADRRHLVAMDLLRQPAGERAGDRAVRAVAQGRERSTPQARIDLAGHGHVHRRGRCR